MTWQVVHLKDAAPSPWKNGGGTTRELIAWPQGDDWLWRMSVADVTQSGPFSRFEGIERWFAVLEGDGVSVATDGQVHRLTADSQPLQFDGSLATDCDLLRGPTRDFNLMTRHGAATATVSRVSGPFAVLIDTTEIIAMYSINTRTSGRFGFEIIHFEPHSLIWQVATQPALLVLESGDALVIRIALTPAVAGKSSGASKDCP